MPGHYGKMKKGKSTTRKACPMGKKGKKGKK